MSGQNKICGWLLVLGLAASVAAGQSTPNLHLTTPSTGTPNWGPLVNTNFTLIDTWSTTVCPKSACTMTGALTAPTVTGTTSVAANYFTQTGSPLTADLACAAGTFWIAPIAGSTNSWRMCNNGALSSIAGGGVISGQASGFIPLATGTTSIGKPSPLSVDDVNTPTLVTSTVKVQTPSLIASGPPAVDIRSSTFGGGAVIDGVTPIDTALASATVAACTGTNGTGILLIPANNGSGAFLQNGALQQSNLTACATSNSVQYKLQGTLKLGSTLNTPSPSTWIADGGSMPNQFAYGEPTAKIIAPVDHGTLGTTVTTGVQTFTPTFTAGSIADFTAASTAITVADNLTCNITSTVVSGVNIVATLSAPSCDIMAGTKVTIAGTSLAELNTTPILLKGDYPAGTFTWNPATRLWAANTAVVLGEIAIDNTSNCALKVTRGVAIGQTKHCLQIVTTAGTTGGTQPSWNATPGGTVTDGTAVWTNYDGSTSAGGTITGLNQSTFESVRISAVSGSVLTANFMHAHTSAASWGMVAIAPKVNSFTNITFKGIQVAGCYGACFWFEHSGDVKMSGVGAGGVGQWLSAIPLELASVLNFDIQGSAFTPILPQNCFMNCSQTGYPCGIRLTMANSSVTPTDFTAFGTIGSHTFVSGCVEADTNGRSSVAIGGLSMSNSIIEQPFQDGILIDPRNATSAGSNMPWILNDVLLQDNNLGFDPSIIGYSYPSPSSLNPGAIFLLGAKTNPLGFGKTVGKYYNGSLIVDGIGGQGHPQFPWRNYAPLGTASNGITLDAELRGEGANFAPAIIPYATLNVVTNPASWTCAGTGCSVTTGILAPDGNATAGEIVTGSVASPTVTVYTYTGTTATGDHFLSGVWCMTGTNAQATENCGSTSQAVPYFLVDSGADQWDGTTSASPSIANYVDDWRNDWWKPIVADNKITSGSGVSHTISMRLIGMSTTGEGGRFWQPFLMYVPYSAKPATFTDTQWDKELSRWRQQLLHGVVPPNMPAGARAYPADALEYFGSDTYIGRGSGAGKLAVNGVDQPQGGVNGSPGSCGDSTHVCQVTTNGAGQVTTQSAVAISNSSFPRKIASVSLTGNTTALSGTTLCTAGSTGTYQLTASINMTTVGTAGTITVAFGWNNGTSAIGSGFVASTSTTSLSGPGQVTVNAHVASGQVITYSTTFTSVTGSPVYTIDAVCTQLQ